MSVQERKTVLEAWLEVTRNTSVHVMVQVGGPALREVQELVSSHKLIHNHNVKKPVNIVQRLTLVRINQRSKYEPASVEIKRD